MKFAASIFVVFLMMAMAICQRSPYAPNPVRYPDVNPRFKRPQTEAEAVGLANRNNVADTTTIRLPIAALGNVDVVNQINRWPEDRRPYWYVNADQIEASQAQPFPAPGQNVQIRVPVRSPFLGTSQA